MKRVILLLAMLAMLLVATLPALAQIGQDSDQEAESGDLDQSFEVVNSGDNSNQCVGGQVVGNTGNAQNSTQLVQYGTSGEEFEFDGGDASIDVSPSNTTECSQSVNQFATAVG